MVSRPQELSWGSAAQRDCWARRGAAAMKAVRAAAMVERVRRGWFSAGLTCEVAASMMEERLMSRQVTETPLDAVSPPGGVAQMVRATDS